MLVMLLLLLTTEILLTSYKPGGPGLDCHHQYKKACLTLRFAPWSIICLNQNLPKWNMKGNLISKTVIEKLPGSHITTGGHHGPHEWTTSYRWFQTSNVWHLPHRWSHPENVKKKHPKHDKPNVCYGCSWIFVCAFWSRFLFDFQQPDFFMIYPRFSGLQISSQSKCLRL